MKKAIARASAALAASALAAAAFAHHGVAAYRMDVVAKLEGTVAKWELGAPHAWLTVEVDGMSWEIEGAPPRWMSAQGFLRDSFAVGDVVTITFHPHRTTPRAGILMEVRSADGTVIKVNRPASLGGP
jgi:hypothetical protein